MTATFLKGRRNNKLYQNFMKNLYCMSMTRYDALLWRVLVDGMDSRRKRDVTRRQIITQLPIS